MTNISIQLYNHVYYTNNDSQILIYDSVNNNHHIFYIDKSSYSYRDGLLLFNNTTEDEELNKLLKTTHDNTLGYISRHNVNVYYFTFNDHQTRLVELNKYLRPSIDSDYIANNYINELIIYIDSHYIPYFNIVRNIEEQIIEPSLLVNLFENCSFTELKKVSFIGRLKSFKKIMHIIDSLKCKFEIEIMMPYNDYFPKNMYYFLGLKISLFCDHHFNNDYINQKERINKAPINKFIYTISNRNDINFIENVDLLEDTKVTIKFSPECDTSILEEYLSYSTIDIFENSISVNQIIINELFNELFWGKITIQHNGDVLSNPNLSIGNLENKTEIEYSKLFEYESLWKKTRKQSKNCSNCCYNCLCPPINIDRKSVV